MGESPKETRPWALSRGAVLTLAGSFVVLVALAIGMNVGGLRERLFGGIGAPQIDSIAVLPFENLSHDPAQDYIADGVTAGLTDRLAQIGAVRVIATTSVTQYKKAPKPLPEVALELNVDAVIQGSVLQSGGGVQVTANFVHAPTGRRLWGREYQRELRGIPDLQAEVARTVAREIRAELTPQQESRLAATRPVEAQAYEAYLKGMYGPEGGKAEEYLKQAIQLDPAYASAYAGLASTYYWSNYFTSSAPRDTYPQAKEAAQKAASLDPTLPEAHYYLALVTQEYDWNFAEAEKEFQRALELNPNSADTRHSYSHYLLSMGRAEESLAQDRRAEEINPADSGFAACLPWHSVATGRYDEAEERAQRALRMGAGAFPRLFLGWSYEQRGRFDDAIVELQKVVVDWGGAVFPTAALGHAYAVAGREAEAREVLDKLLARSKTEYVSAYEIAAVYAGLGDRERAFEWLERAYEERSNALARFRMDPRLRNLHSDARFQELVRRMNFPQAGQE